MSLNAKRDNFNREDLLKVGTLIGNFKKESQHIINTVIDVVAEWQSYASTTAVFEPLSKEINNHVRLKL